jgi:non-ribosomal peptide synthetase component F/thioesterase domain-containing protein/acyl carrier protein
MNIEDPPVLEVPVSDDPSLDGIYVFPAGLEQSRYWLLDRLAGASTASNMAVAFRLEGPIEDAQAEHCVRELVLRHEVLRTTFRMIDEALSQVISEEPVYSFTVSDLRGLPEAARLKKAEDLLHEHSRIHIDLAFGPAFFVHLIHVTDSDHLLAFTVHHIACDGWSNGILVRDFAALYEAATQKRKPTLPELPFQFADFTVWQHSWLESEAARAALDYWKEHIRRDLPAIDLPTDFPRSAQKSFPGDIEGRLLSPVLTARLKAYCRQHDATMHQLLLAAFEGLISRYAGQTEFLLGSTIANRTQPGMENVIGRFAHPQVILADVRGNPSYRELLGRVVDWSAKSYAHQDLPFSRLTEEFQLDQAGATSRFLQVYFVYQKAFMQPQTAGSLRIQPRPSVSGGVNFDMLVSIVERAEGPRLQIEYNTVLFRRERICRLLDQYIRVLEAVMDDDALAVSELPLLSPQEHSTLKLAGTGPALRPVFSEDSETQPLPASLAQCFDLQAEARGGSPALVNGASRISWSDLQIRSLRFAGALEKLGLRPGQTVAVRIEPTAGSAAAAIAVLRLGAVVMPVPASVSSAEWQTIRAQFQPSLSLASQSFAEKFSSVTAFEQLDVEPSTSGNPVPPSAADIAWLGAKISADGSYEKILVSHAAAARSLRSAAQALGFRAGDAVLVFPATALSPLALTDAWTDLLLPLLSGATIVYPGESTPAEMQSLLDREQISYALGAPAEWARLFGNGWPGDRRINLICRGSRVSSVIAEQLAKSPCRVWSMLSSATTAGPFALARLDTSQPSQPVQWPLAPLPGDSLRILDAWCSPVPFAVPGELIVQRDSAELRPGYVALYSPGLGFEAIEQAGRSESLHGYRLRLGELEDLLMQEPSVALAEAAIQPDPNGRPVLVAYIAGKNGGQPSISAVSAWLKSVGSQHLASAELIALASIPHRLDGSADLAALPSPGSSPFALVEEAGFVPPRDELETRLVTIWESVLGVHGIGIRTNFFTLGGYSLMIVRLFANINRALSVSLPITTIFNAPTVEQLADVIRGRTLCSPLVPVQPSGSKPPFFLIHSYLLYGGLPGALGDDRPFYGLRELNQSMTMEDRVVSYAKEIRSIQPKGPYYIGGWCAAGPLAVETARQLIEAGEEVAMVVLFDSWRPGYAAELAAQHKRMPEMALRARVYRKFRYHRLKTQSLSTQARLKYAWNAVAEKLSSTRAKLYLRHWGFAQRLFSQFGLPLPNFMHNVSLQTLEAIRTYNGRPFAGRITLIRATDSVYIPGAEPGCGWGALAGKGIDVEWAPGTHESMFVEPNLSVVGDILRNSLEKAEAPSS